MFVGGLFECRLQENHDQVQDSQQALINPSQSFLPKPSGGSQMPKPESGIHGSLGGWRAGASKLWNAI